MKSPMEGIGLVKLDLTKFEFQQKTDVISIGVYPIMDKEFKEIKAMKAFNLVITIEITLWLGDFKFEKTRHQIKRKIEGDEYELLIYFFKEKEILK
ncbi:hypothetical protein SAMN05421786_11514 [Chryseobacterium ureilyticum]|uniref:Uncharacterized protein n=1 Tax=Chryseobacterium ureilyticum TaxID=373668 RepID=A0A1N7QRQ8_9FLAO|nr:hypothetical protein [Chryseobacterium ureilyticum]SIT25488.1 hypothetical protein SAMN05421786_11514 [Chryseobacterium ureilyticum]